MSWRRRLSALIIQKYIVIWLSLVWSDASTHLRPRISVEAGSDSEDQPSEHWSACYTSSHSQTHIAALKQVKHLINSRPLTYVSVDPSAPEPLTPYHLLLGRANPSIPPDVFSSADLSCRRRWRVAHAIADQFWRRWMTKYMPSLTERRKWLKEERNLRVGDIVLVIDDKTPRGL